MNFLLVVFFSCFFLYANGYVVPLREKTVISSFPLLPKDTVGFAGNDNIIKAGGVVNGGGLEWFRIYTSPTADTSAGFIEKMMVKYFETREDAERYLLKKKKNDGLRDMRHRIISRNPQWRREIIRAIKEGRVLLGMDYEQLAASWGDPLKRKKFFILNLGDCEACFYNDETIVILKDGAVSGWTR
ncbi:MAG: hypothetical protein ACLFQK_03925 [Fibrobacterota bacterium]